MSSADSSIDTALELAAQATIAFHTRSELPQELADLIVWNLQAAYGSGEVSAASLKRDLCALSLMSRPFLSACQHALFETVILQPPIFVLNGRRVKGRETALRFSRLISQSPHLAALIKVLVFRFPYAAEYDEGNNESLITALSKLVNVTELRLEGSEGRDRHSRLEIFDPDYDGTKWTGVQRELLRIMQRATTKTLKLKNVAVPSLEMGKIKGVESLEVDDSYTVSISRMRRSSLPPPEEVTGITPLYIKHFTYKGSYMINDHVLNTNLPPCIASDWFKPRWDELDTLSLPIEDSHIPRPNRLPRTILSSAKHLRELHMHTMNAFRPGWDEETMTLPHRCPMRWLHPDSYETLTRISVSVEFDLETATIEDRIRDPYQGLFRDGVLKKCVNLEELSVRVLIGGHRWKFMVRQSFGRQWGRMDRVLAPNGKKSPFPKLKRVELVVGNEGVFDERDVRVHRKRFRRMFGANFDGLKALRDAGRIELYLGILHKRSPPAGKGEDKGKYDNQEGSDVEDLEEGGSGSEEEGNERDEAGGDVEIDEDDEEESDGDDDGESDSEEGYY